MVFKGRFFSSKKSDTSSPDGSYNSPRSTSSKSPSRSDSKKKGKSTSKDNSPSTPTSFSSFAAFRDKKKDVKAKESHNLEAKETNKGVTDSKEVGTTSFPLSPIMASSLGLNKIKTRSGPLPKESFFGHKGNALGASNLSKTGVDEPLIKKSSVKKDEKKSVLGSMENAGRVGNVSDSYGMSAESAALRDRSSHIPGPSRLQTGESFSGAGTTCDKMLRETPLS